MAMALEERHKVEKILCISEKDAEIYLGSFQNFNKINRIDWIDYNELMGTSYEFIDRESAEKDPSWKQIIPYVVLRSGFDVFHYMRGKSGGETRLHSLFSVGIGGHINDSDGTLKSLNGCITNCITRELKEEVGLQNLKSQPTPSAIIYDPSNEVGTVHLGLVYIYDIEKKDTVKATEIALANSGWTPIRNAKGKIYTYENWSQLVLQGEIL